MVANVSVKEDVADLTVKGSQFKKPLLEFSGSCAGCAETAYARLITQLFGDRMYISNATGCSSIWGGPAATSPYTTTAEGKGPAWANSLFEDNAEHGLGLYLGQKAIPSVSAKIEAQIAKDWPRPTRPASGWTRPSRPSWTPRTTALPTPGCQGPDCRAGEGRRQTAARAARPVRLHACRGLAEKEYLTKKSVWIFGGDGWAYDIGFGGVDHVLASGEDVNIFVFDTEVYSNTGGQASKASNIGQVAQFAAAGKTMPRRAWRRSP